MGVHDWWDWLGGSDSQIRVESGFGTTVREGETAICLDCRVTFGIRNRACPNCASEHFWLMAKWMQAPVRTRPVAVPFREKRATRGSVGLRNAMRPWPARVVATGNQEGEAARGAAWVRPRAAPSIAR